MEEKIRSIHILNSAIDRVELCLSNCQITNSNKIENILTKTKSISIVKRLFKESTATFYILQTGNIISVYSAYFENNFDTKEIGRWFAMENSLVFLLDYSYDSSCEINVFKKYKFLTPLILKKDTNGIKHCSLFKFNEIGSIFKFSERDLKVEFNSLEEYLKYFSSLFKIPLSQNRLDVIGNPNTEIISFYI